MTLSDNDQKQIRQLLLASAEAKNMVKMQEVAEVLSGGFAAALKAAHRYNWIDLDTAHRVAYDIALEGFPTPMEHLSVSHPKTLVEADVMTIAAEFGLGDRSTWLMHIPPKGPVKAFHIFRGIATKS